MIQRYARRAGGGIVGQPSRTGKSGEVPPGKTTQQKTKGPPSGSPSLIVWPLRGRIHKSPSLIA